MFDPFLFSDILRHHMHRWVIRSLSINAYLRQYETPLLDIWARISAFLVSEASIAFLIISSMWLLETSFARHFAFCVCICFAIVCFVKDLLCLPRPPRTLMSSRDDVNETDWGFPSLHTAVGFTSALFVWMYYYWESSSTMTTVTDRSGTAFWTLSTAVVLWCLSTSVSRIYLGVHSAFDVMGGALIGVTVVVVYMLMMDVMDEWFFRSSIHGPLWAFVMACLVIWKHPITEPLTPTYATSTMLISVATGTVMGYFLNDAVGYAPQTFLERSGVLPITEGGEGFYSVSGRFFGNALCRWGVGFPIVILFRFIIKNSAAKIFTTICKWSNISYEHQLEKRLEKVRSFTHLHASVLDQTPATENNNHNNNNHNNNNNTDNITHENNDDSISSHAIFKRSGLDSEYFVKGVTYNLLVMSVICIIPRVYDQLGI